LVRYSIKVEKIIWYGNKEGIYMLIVSNYGLEESLGY